MDKLDICSKCPGTLWGAKSICRVFDKHISVIPYCKEWTPKEPIPTTKSQFDANDQFNEMLILVKDYRWMKIEMQRLYDRMNEITTHNTANSIIAPSKVKHRVDRIGEVIGERDGIQLRIRRLEDKIGVVDTALAHITNERLITIAQCIMDGMRMNVIATHVGVSRQRLHELRIILIDQMVEVTYNDSKGKGQSSK